MLPYYGILILISIFAFTDGINIVSCDPSGETFLYSNSFTIFQSPQYPSILNYSGISSLTCYHKFTTNDSHIWFALINGDLQYFDLTGFTDPDDYITQRFIWDKMPSWFSYFTPYPQFEFAATDYMGAYGWRGFQAFVYAPDVQDNFTCPLSNKKFYIANNVDFYPITSSFWYLQDVKEANADCKWEFYVYTGFRLKLHIKQMNLAANESLQVSADGNITDIIAPGVYYFDESNVIITYQKSAHSAKIYGFGGVVTGFYVKNAILNDCDPLYTYNYSRGYGNNAFCEESVLIAPNEVRKLSYFGFLEDGVDKLTATDALGNEIIFHEKGDWIIDEGSENVTFTFESDGNLIAAGHVIQWENTTCNCPNQTQIADCRNTYLYWNTIYLPVSCKNINCSLSIVPNATCQDLSMLIFSKFSLRSKTKDTVKLYSNSNLLSNFNSSNPGQNCHLLNPNTTIKVEHETDDSLHGIIIAPYATILVTFLNRNFTNTTIQLTPDNFTSTINLYNTETQSYITVTAPKGTTLDFFLVESFYYGIPQSDLRENLLIDEENNFAVTLDTLPRHTSYGQMRYYTAAGNTLKLYISRKTLGTVFVRVREFHTKNCANPENIAVISNTTITVSSTSDGPCYFTLLGSQGYSTVYTEYMNLKTNATENVKFVVGTDSSLIFFEFNSQTAASWSRLFFSGLANSFWIPPSSSITFRNLDFEELGGYQKYNVTKGIFTSKTFADPYEQVKNYNWVLIKEGEKCRVTVKYLNLSSNATFGVSLGSWQPPQLLTQVNQTLEFAASSYPKEPRIYIELNETQKGYRGYVLEYEMMTASSQLSSKVTIILFFVVLCFL